MKEPGFERCKYKNKSIQMEMCIITVKPLAVSCLFSNNRDPRCELESLSLSRDVLFRSCIRSSHALIPALNVLLLVVQHLLYCKTLSDAPQGRRNCHLSGPRARILTVCLEAGSLGLHGDIITLIQTNLSPPKCHRTVIKTCWAW